MNHPKYRIGRNGNELIIFPMTIKETDHTDNNKLTTVYPGAQLTIKTKDGDVTAVLDKSQINQVVDSLLAINHILYAKEYETIYVN